MAVRTRTISNEDILSAKGMTLSAIGDLSPVEMEIEVIQALAEGAGRTVVATNSTGFDDEIRAYEAGKGQQEVLDMFLPDQITDPFEEALSGAFEMQDYYSPFDFPTEVPDLVAAALL